MRKERTLLILGLLVMIISFTGFPIAWRNMFFVLIGAGLVYLAYLFYIEAKARISKVDDSSKTFVDNIGIGE